MRVIINMRVNHFKNNKTRMYGAYKLGKQFLVNQAKHQLLSFVMLMKLFCFYLSRIYLFKIVFIFEAVLIIDVLFILRLPSFLRMIELL